MEKLPKIAQVYFTYKKDFDLLKQSIHCFKRTMSKTKDIEAEIFVFDDGYNAFSPKEKAELLELFPDIHYKMTFYNRNGNLLGGDNLKGQTKAMLEASIISKSDVLIKSDSDSMIFGLDWIREFIDSNANITGCYKGDPWYVMGFCYALKSSILQPLAEDAVTYKAWHCSFEDYEVGQRVARLSQDPYTSHLRNPHGESLIVGNPLPLSKELLESVLNNHLQVYSCGWAYTNNPNKTTFKAEQKTFMFNLNKAIDEIGGHNV